MEQQEQPEQVNDSPIEEVRLTVPITDDPSLQALTFRTWVLGLTACTILAFITRLLDYRQNPSLISGSFIQMLIFPLGKLMAAILPTTAVRIPGTKLRFSLNPGPFNVKEHVLITMLANCGLDLTLGVVLVTLAKAFYHRDIHPLAAYLLNLTTEMTGYGCAGVFVKLLVDSPYMWWPSTLAEATFYRALHETKVQGQPRGQLTRSQFLIIVLVCIFTYQLIPSYFFPSITTLSVTCWIWKNSVKAQQIGSGRHGLGIGSISLDWSEISAWMGNPLVSPPVTLHNTIVGFVLFVYIVTPIVYWTNSYKAKTFPIISSHLFDEHGQVYNITRILDKTSMTFDRNKYDLYSKAYMSPFFAYGYGFNFAAASAALAHVLLFNGREICSQFKKAAASQSTGDIHNRIMKKNYASVPQWWYHLLAFTMMALSILNSHFFGHQLQFPWWGILVAYLISMFSILPGGVIQATTSADPPLNLFGDLIAGYMYSGRPIGVAVLRGYTDSIAGHALNFLQSFKLGVYMKIPPRSMFIVQLVGIVITCSVQFVTAWWLLSTVDNICDVTKLPTGSPWTCAGMSTEYDISLIWGALGPSNIFAPDGLYSSMYYFFIMGVAATTLVWILIRMFPEQKWIKSIHIPIILGASSSMPSTPSATYWGWWVVGISFNVIVYNKFQGWWAKYNYVLSAGLDSGVAIFSLLLNFALQAKGVYGLNWWGLEYDDHCPLAHCPMAPGIQVDGCPVF